MLVTYKQLTAIVANYVATNKIAQDSPFVPSVDNIAGLVDKISKIVMLDGKYEDKLALLDGEDLPLGKTIEEYYQDISAPLDYDATGANALSPHLPTFRPACYSYTLGRKKFVTTEKYNDLERACNTEGEFETMVGTITKKLWDSFAVYKYQIKRELLGKYAGAAITEQNTVTIYAVSTAYDVNTILKSAANSDVRGIVVKAITSTSYATTNTWAANVSAGYIVELDLVKDMAIPTDEATGESFIEQLKKDIELASDISEGHSLNGNALGVSEAGLVLFVKQGVMPVIDTKVLAGAFHTDKVAIPSEVIVVKDFGSDSNGVYAVLMDRRGCRVHNDYRAIRTQLNADGDFMNYFLHTENTAFWSKNTFIKVYKDI